MDQTSTTRGLQTLAEASRECLTYTSGFRLSGLSRRRNERGIGAGISSGHRVNIGGCGSCQRRQLRCRTNLGAVLWHVLNTFLVTIVATLRAVHSFPPPSSTVIIIIITVIIIYIHALIQKIGHIRDVLRRQSPECY